MGVVGVEEPRLLCECVEDESEAELGPVGAPLRVEVLDQRCDVSRRPDEVVANRRDTQVVVSIEA